MSDRFVPIIPGAIDALGTKHRLSWRARSMLLWLAVTVDRKTGIADSVTVNAINELTGCSWRSVKRSLTDLEAAGLVEAYLPRGHDGWVKVLCHTDLVSPDPRRSRGTTGRNRGSTGRSRASTDGKRASAGANRENGAYNNNKLLADDAATASAASSSANTASSANGKHRDGCTCFDCHHGPQRRCPDCNTIITRPADLTANRCAKCRLHAEDAS